jgi:hypothetical protein
MKVLVSALGLAVLLSAAVGYLRHDDAPAALRDIHYSKDVDYSVSAAQRRPRAVEPFTAPADRP